MYAHICIRDCKRSICGWWVNWYCCRFYFFKLASRKRRYWWWWMMMVSKVRDRLLARIHGKVSCVFVWNAIFSVWFFFIFQKLLYYYYFALCALRVWSFFWDIHSYSLTSFAYRTSWHLKKNIIIIINWMPNEKENFQITL